MEKKDASHTIAVVSMTVLAALMGVVLIVKIIEDTSTKGKNVLAKTK